MEYRKRFRGLVIWLVGYLALALAPLLLPEGTDAGLVMRLVFNLTSAGIAALM